MPLWQWPTPPPVPFVIVRDVTASGPPTWSYWVPGLAAVLTILGAYFIAAKQSQSAINIANKNAETTMKATAAQIQANLDLLREEATAVREREAESSRRQDRALKRRIAEFLDQSKWTVLAEAESPTPTEDRAERSAVLLRFVEIVYCADAISVYDDEQVDALHHAAASLHYATLRMQVLANRAAPLTEMRLSRARIVYLRALDLCCDALDALHKADEAASGRREAELLMAKHEIPAIWADAGIETSDN
jgi:hypothetical protein